MKSVTLSLFTLAVVLCTACNKNDDPDIPDGQVKFSSGIQAPQTKVGGANGDQWEGNESIGVYMSKHTDGQILANSANVLYTTTSSGTAATFTSSTPLYYPVDGSKVNFMAYHPHNGSTNGYIYPVDLSIQNPQSGIDLMTATADNMTAGYDKTHIQPVDLGLFEHQLTKIVMNVIAGDGVGSLNNMAVTINGMNTTADFDLAGQTITNEDNISGISPSPGTAGTNTYEAILLPVTLGASHTVTFTTADFNTYTWTMSDNDANITSLDKGYQYTFHITLTKHAVEATGTIKPWESPGIINGTAD